MTPSRREDLPPAFVPAIALLIWFGFGLLFLAVGWYEVDVSCSPAAGAYRCEVNHSLFIGALKRAQSIDVVENVAELAKSTRAGKRLTIDRNESWAPRTAWQLGLEAKEDFLPLEVFASTAGERTRNQWREALSDKLNARPPTAFAVRLEQHSVFGGVGWGVIALGALFAALIVRRWRRAV